MPSWLRRLLGKRFDRDYGQRQRTSNLAAASRTRGASLSDVNGELKAAFAGKPFENNVHKGKNKTKEQRESASHSRDKTKIELPPLPAGTPKKARYIVLYDYNARAQHDLTIKKHECVELLEKHGDWLKMKSLATSLEGFVPANYVADYWSIEAQEWYVGAIRRGEIEHRLMASENQDGSFLVRDSESRKNEYSLSVRDGNKIRHYRITPMGDFFCINKANKFSKIHDLIEFYSNYSAGLCQVLTKPCVKRVAPEIVGLSCDVWEIPREEIRLKKLLGFGNFGEVHEGVWNNSYPVAVKTMKSGTMQKEDFLAEAEFLKGLHHPNLLQLYAVCTLEEPLYIITELMRNGSLLEYLRGPGSNLPQENLIEIGAQVACGMEYLETQNYIHRDLAARNVLVGEGNTVKVADFGLSRFVKEEEYEAREGALFPVKWTAPEAVTHNKFSIKSDVWSFGIFMAEVITHGAKPYPGMNNMEVASKIEQGYRMPQPPNCPQMLYEIMLDTWIKDPMKRPTFATLRWKLEDFYSLDASEYKEAIEIA